MYHFVLITIAFLSPFFVFGEEVQPAQQPPEFVIVIPSYNNGKNNHNRCIGNLESVICQTYPHYSVIYVEDVSTDDTAQLVDKFVADHHVENKFKVIHNKERKGGLRNIYEAVYTVAPDKIIINLDGDDAFANDKVLEHLAEIYADKNIWITFGNCTCRPDEWAWTGPTDPVPQELISANKMRYYQDIWLHPRTFYAKLFHQIKKEDMLQQDGKFYVAGWDMAFMAPMLDMASLGHFKKLPEILYLYYCDNPLRDSRINGDLQLNSTIEIRNKPAYTPLKTLFPEVS